MLILHFDSFRLNGKLKVCFTMFFQVLREIEEKAAVIMDERGIMLILG